MSRLKFTVGIFPHSFSRSQHPIQSSLNYSNKQHEGCTLSEARQTYMGGCPVWWGHRSSDLLRRLCRSYPIFAVFRQEYAVRELTHGPDEDRVSRLRVLRFGPITLSFVTPAPPDRVLWSTDSEPFSYAFNRDLHDSLQPFDFSAYGRHRLS